MEITEKFWGKKEILTGLAKFMPRKRFS